MRNSERGQALMVAIVGVALVILTLLTALTITQFSGKLVYAQLLYQGQALSVAQAGLTEGQSWFRRQAAQPVVNFFPQRNTSSSPPVYDTEVQNTGLVRTFQVSNQGNVWGQYLLKRTFQTGDPVTYSTNTIDVTSRKGKEGSGIAWQLESQGTIFVKNGASFDPTVSPNKILAKQLLRNEIQRISLNRPGDAALSLSRGDCLSVVNTNAEIRGMSSGGSIFWVNSPSGSTPTGGGYPGSGNIQGATGTITGTPNRFTIPYIFGLTDQELITAANIVATNTNLSELPNPLPPMQIIVLNNPGQTFAFTAAQPLTGSGILVVFGNLTIPAGSLSLWNGFVFVRGAFNMSAPSSINGAVVVDAGSGTTRNVVLTGSSDKADIRYDPGLLTFIQQRLGIYNVTRSAYVPCPATGPCN